VSYLRTRRRKAIRRGERPHGTHLVAEPYLFRLTPPEGRRATPNADARRDLAARKQRWGVTT
jgi:hypothetical protein